MVTLFLREGGREGKKEGGTEGQQLSHSPLVSFVFRPCLGLAFSHREYRQSLPDNVDVLHNMKEVLSVR